MNSHDKIKGLESQLTALKAEANNPQSIRTVKIGNLEWQADVAKRMTWDKAKEYAASLGDGWRLPTVQELVSLWDYDKDCCPQFPEYKDWLWSSSPYGSYSAWIVGFGSGRVDGYGRSTESGARCVR